MQTFQLNELKVGTRVIFVDRSLNIGPACYVDAPSDSNETALYGRLGVVVALNAGPGKIVGVCFKDSIAGGHSCDLAMVPHGHGFWVRPEHLYSEDAWTAHKQEAAAADVQGAEIRDMLKGFLGV